MDRLQFSGLPECCRVGPATLLPISMRDGHPQKCCVCKKVSVDYYLCASGHGYCPDCVPPSDLRRRWCVVCADDVEFTAEKLSPSFLEGSSFSCSCSFTGTLSQIREHLLNTGSPGLCYGQMAVEDEHRSETSSCCQETSDSLIRDLEKARFCLERHEAMISMLADGLSTMQMLFDVSSPDRKIFCFDFATLSSREPVEHHKVVDKMPLRIQASVVGLEDEPYLCVSVAGSDIAARTATWPFRKCISCQILDVHGQPIETYEFPTFENGDYTHESFVDPTLDPSSTGLCILKSLADILHFYPEESIKHILISASVKNIQI